MASDKSEARIRNSRRNILVASVGQLVVAVFTFLERRVFLSFLSVDYLGINGLYTSLLSFLSIAELGIGSAIIYCLYKPIAEDDHEQIAALMRLFKRIYAVIGIFIITVGLCCIPFLDLIIDSDLSSRDLSLYFVIFLANSCVGYFFSFKIYFIEANQKKYIYTAASVASQIIQYLLQMAVVVITRNYYVYLLVALVVNLLKHIYLSITADRMYPYINGKVTVPVSADVKTRIIKNTKGVFLTRIADVVVKSTDSVLITMYVSLAVTGLYSNYQMVVVGVTTTVSMLFSSVTASIGNLCATEDDDAIYESFRKLDLACFLIYGTVAVVLAVAFEPLVSVLFGAGFAIGQSTAVLICLSFLVTGLRQSVLIYREVMGLFWEDRYKSIFQIVINIVVSIVLGRMWGIDGILIGTVLSTVLTCSWIEPYVVYHKGFHRHVGWYYLGYLGRLFMLAVIYIVSFFARSLFAGESALMDLVFSLVCPLCCCLVFYLVVYFRNRNMRSLLGLMRRSIRIGRDSSE